MPVRLDDAFDKIRRGFDRLDAVFPNAGIGLAKPPEAVTEQKIGAQFAVSFKGIFFTVQKAPPLMTRGGSIVLTTSHLNAVARMAC